MSWSKTITVFTIAAGTSLLSGTASTEPQDFRMRAHTVSATQPARSDVEAEIRFGRDVAARILGRHAVLRNDEVNHYVSLVGASVAMSASRSEISYHFAVLDSEHINAYSAPGGYIFVTRGAIAAAADEAELAAVLAHEIAHINQRHIVNDLNIAGAGERDLTNLSRIIGASGDTTRIALSRAIDKALIVLFETGYRQEQELAADQEATLLLGEAGYDPTALLRYLQREVPGTDTTEPAVTHPKTALRLDKLSDLIRRENLSGERGRKAATRFQQNLKEIVHVSQ